MTGTEGPRRPGIDNDVSENRHKGDEKAQPSAVMDYVTDQTRGEVTELRAKGVDVAIVDYDLEGHFQLDPETQKKVDTAIETYSQTPDFSRLLETASPAISGWLGMAKDMSPLALGFFYNMANMTRPSDGLSREAILDTPLAAEGGKTATELVKELYPEKKAALKLERLDNFFQAGSLKEERDAFGLTTYEIMAGSLDRIADVTRAKALSRLVQEHIQRYPERYAGKGLVSTSLASGAAEPVYWLVRDLQAAGQQVDRINLVDRDPIAIAASLDRSTYYGLNDKIAIHAKNLFEEPVDSYVEPQGTDVVDIVGLFEYLPGRYAEKLLQDAARITKPGGVMVFGNMLMSRPQQKWFEGLWPKLQQRSVEEVIEIVERAGFSRDQLRIHIPPDGVYAIYSLEIPMEDDNSAPRNMGQTAASQVVQRV